MSLCWTPGSSRGRQAGGRVYCACGDALLREGMVPGPVTEAAEWGFQVARVFLFG